MRSRIVHGAVLVAMATAGSALAGADAPASVAVTALPPVARTAHTVTGAQRRASRSAGRSASLNWTALARCESGGNPRAIGGGGAYRGLYQFTMGTWRSLGGSGDPINVSPGEQTYRAQVLYKRSGARPWGGCGSRLYS